MTNEELDRMIDAGEIEFANGFKTKFRRIQPGLFLELVKAHPEPMPPKRESKSKIPGGGVELIEDKDDLEYQLAYARWDQETGKAWAELVFRHLDPELPEDSGWLEDVEALQIKVPDSKRGREVLYLKCRALDAAAIALASRVLARASGLTEERAAEALDTFPRHLGRDANNGRDGKEGVPASKQQGEPAPASPQSDNTHALGVDVDKPPDRHPSPRVRTKRRRKVRER